MGRTEENKEVETVEAERAEARVVVAMEVGVRVEVREDTVAMGGGENGGARRWWRGRWW